MATSILQTPPAGKIHHQFLGQQYLSNRSRALPGGVWGTPAFFNGTLYYGAAYDTLKAFPMANAKLAATPSSQTAITFAFPGTTPSISANGTQNGIVWTLEGNASSAAVLHAYDATNLATELYNSGQAASGRDSFGNGNNLLRHSSSTARFMSQRPRRSRLWTAAQ